VIVSASRRTDIPAYHPEWMINRLRAGTVLVRNPVHKKTVYRLDLSPRNVGCIVFLTKNPAPMIPYMDEISDMGYRCMFQMTVTPYGGDIEPHVPPKSEVVESFREVSEKIGRDHVIWRYDPILLSERINVSYHQRKFATLCNELDGFTDRCVFSFLDYYSKLDGQVARGTMRSPDTGESEAIAYSMARTADEHGMELSYCCSKRDLSGLGIKERGCIDRDTLLRLGIPFESDGPSSREHCRCVKAIDIGMYDTCDHGCIYCYANSHGMRSRGSSIYNPESEMLFGSLGPGDDVVSVVSDPTSKIDEF
jgi:hypothetical protein